MKNLGWIALVGALAVTVGCVLSDYTIEMVNQARTQVEQRKKEIETSRSDLAAFLESDASVGYRNAAEEEEWSARIDAAAAKIAKAEEVLDKQVQPIVEESDYDREYDAQTLAQDVMDLAAGARQELGFWRERKAALDQAKEKASDLAGMAKQSVVMIDNRLDTLKPRLAAAKREFPDQAEPLDALVTPLLGRGGAAREAARQVAEQAEAHSAGKAADYGILARQAEYVNESRELILESAEAVEARFAELNHSYSKTLIDMKAEYMLTIRRQSWDNSKDYPSLHNVDYEIKVDGGTFDYFDSINGSLAQLKLGWFGDDLSLLSGVDQKRWDALKIDVKSNWFDEDDEAEFWMEKGTAKYFHKYHVVENGEVAETDWVPVDEAFFFANLDNLGMDVESKPYGVFEKDKLTHAAPPGMAYVGNERYGRWERQGGGSVWTWIAPYLFYRSLFGSPWMYQRNEWNTWRTGYYGSRPYYGSGSSPMYGTRSSRTQTSSLGGSQFGRSGGFNRPAGSVRGAGPASRGGGFGGSGK